MKRSDVIDNKNIQGGDVIVGLASSGQAPTRKKYNGGMGSNGLTPLPAMMSSQVFSAEISGKLLMPPFLKNWFTPED